MPDREDAAVEPMKVSLADQPRDLRRAQPRGCELKTGDHSVLTRGQCGHRSGLCVHTTQNPAQWVRAPFAAIGPARTAGRPGRR